MVTQIEPSFTQACLGIVIPVRADSGEGFPVHPKSF
jgi:hypothetical protein